MASTIYRNMLKDKNHPFHEIINFSDDGSSFVSYDGKTRPTISGNKDLSENVVRELIAQTYLQNSKERYACEYPVDGKNRADLVAYIHGQIGSIIEVKQLSITSLSATKFSKTIDQTFSQLSMYAASQKNKDLYASVVFVDIEKVIQDPSGFTIYHNKQQNQKFNGFDAYQETGIYIETKRYLSQLDKFEDDKAHHHFPSIVCIEKHVELRFGTTQQKVKIKEAVKLPSASSDAYGIKNVRNIKNHEDHLEKRDLTLGILETILIAYRNRNKEYIASSGKSKDFLFSLEETIDFQIEHDEYNSIYLVLMNGAIIDGQNSIDSFRYIMQVMEDHLQSKTLKSSFEIKIQGIIKNNLKDINEIRLMLDFIKNSYVNISLDVAKNPEEAREIAITKNKTMLVTENELKSSHSNIQIPLQILSSDLMTKYGTTLTYPKQDIFFPSVFENTISSEELASLINVFYSEAHRGGKKALEYPYSSCLDMIKQISGKTKPRHYDFIIKNFIEEDKKIKSKTVIKVEKQYEKIRQNRLMMNDRIKDLEERINNGQDYIDLLEEDKEKLAILRDEESFYKSKLKALQNSTYISKNLELLNDIILFSNRMRKVVERKIMATENSDPYAIELLKTYIKKSFCRHILGMLIFKMKKDSKQRKLNIRKIIQTTDEEIEMLFDKMIEGVKTIENHYDVGAVQIKNSGNEEQRIQCEVDEEFYSLEEVRGVYLNV